MKTDKKEVATTQFLQISTKRLFVLNVITLGLYELYWFYYNWNQIRISRERNIWPLARTIFSIFFVIQLFKEIVKTVKFKSSSVFESATFLGILYIVCNLLLILPDRLQKDGSGLEITWIILFVVSILVFLPIQTAVNNATNQSSPHTKMSVGEKIIVTLGVILTSLYILSSFFLIEQM